MPLLTKNQLKNLAAYKQSKHCEEENSFVVEGEKLSAEALASEFKVRVICAKQEWLQRNADKVRGADEVYEVNADQLERLSSLRSPNQVWMLLERPLVTSCTASDNLTLLLDHIQDPGNMGTIMRSADWYGVRQIVCSRDTVSCYNPKVVQATMGAIFRTQVTYCDLSEYIQITSKEGLPIYGATLGGSNLYQATLRRPALLVIGNESTGISASVASLLTEALTIPNIGGTAESLNAAVATSILLSEFYRR